MGYYCHPDTLIMAAAHGAAQRSGHTEGSLEWLRVYRDAYEREARGSYPRSLAEYLGKLDEHIAEAEQDEPGLREAAYWQA